MPPARGRRLGRLGRLLRTRLVSTTSLAVATTAVVVMAVTATGVPVSHVSANNGGVWITDDNPGNGFRGTFGQLDVAIGQIGYDFGDPGAVPRSTYDLGVLQEGTTALAVDHAASEIYPVDALSGQPDTAAEVSIPPDSQVALDGGVAAVLSPSSASTPARLWVAQVGTGPTASLSGLDTATTKPALSVAGGAALAVDDAGDVYVASRSEVVSLPFVRGAFGRPQTIKLPEPLSAVELTTVGRQPVLLDPAERVVHFPRSGIVTTLPTSLGAGTGADLRLQDSGPAAGAVLVATAASLISVPLSGAMPSVLARAPGGVPAAPVSLDGCAYAAWSGSPGQAAQVCRSGARYDGPLAGPTGRPLSVSKPVFRVNNNQIVLNDTADGATWTVAGSSRQVVSDRDWQALIAGTSPRAQSGHKSTARSEASESRHRPRLRNPTLYALPGRQSVLHVLDLDSDPGGSILSITGVSPASGPGFSLRVSADTETVVLSLATGASAPVRFTYQVVDGFGLAATGQVVVVPTSTKSPPRPPTKPLPVRAVTSGATVSFPVLGGWRDRQNAPLSLTSATVVGEGGQVSWDSDGEVTFLAPVVAADTAVTVRYGVTDGSGAVVHGQARLVVLGRADLRVVPPTALPEAVRVLVGQAAQVSPLANDIFGADPSDPAASLSLAGPVTPVAGLSVSSNLGSGQLTLTAARPGTYSLTYRAAYGSGLSAPTQILVQAAGAPGRAQAPVTGPQSVILRGQYPATLDVLASDYDPQGGVLTVVGAEAPPGLAATVVSGKWLRIAALSADPSADQVVTYQVTNGLTPPVTGQVTALWEPPSPPTPPVVPATFATVRAGDEVSVDVLAGASDPDGEPVRLVTGGTPAPVTLRQGAPGRPYPTGLGVASVSGADLLYAAPAGKGMRAPESVTVSYQVESELGETTTAHTYVTVVPDTSADDAAPQPLVVDARVTAGATVTIPIPTTGVAPDGDSVTVTGITSPPRLGRVVSYNADSITYEAYPFAPGSGSFAGGTDSFGYQVEGPSGLRADSTVRVGVSPPSSPQPPVALDHLVTAAPGQVVDVDLLAGDDIATGDQVSVEPLRDTNRSLPAGVSLSGSRSGILRATAPSGPEPLSISFALTDGTAAASVAQVVIRSQPGYVTPPVAVDYYPAPPAANARSIEVDVLRRDSDPGGRPGDLVVVGSPAAGVSVDGADLRIPVSAYPRAVPYVIRSRTSGATALGVVYVPAATSGAHLISSGVVRVPRDGSTTVDIARYIADPGRVVRLTTTDEVFASPSGGLSARVDSNTTVTLSGHGGYAGPGALIVQVIDAASLSARGAQTSMISLPVLVGTPTPVLRCPQSPLSVVEGGGAVDAAVASVCQVWYPPGSSAASTTFSERWSHPAAGVTLGWAPGQVGRVVSLVARSSAAPGAAGSIVLGVPHALPSATSTLEVLVVAAPPPTATPVDLPAVRAGQTATVDMAQYVTSPLAKPQIDVTGVHQTGGPPASTATAGAVVRITPHAGDHGTIGFVVDVSDQGPGRPDRVVTDTITLQVLGPPGAPSGLQGVPGPGQVQLSWIAAAPDGSPVTHYVVSSAGGSRQVSGTSYTWSGLVDGRSYDFTVTAVNQVGTGPPSPPVSVAPRAAPGTPSGVSATTAGDRSGQATVSWAPAASNGEPITAYTVFVSPHASGPASVQVAGGRTSLTWNGLSDAVGPYSFTVVAHNSVGAGPISAPSNQVFAHGVPATPAPPHASGQVSTDQTTTTVVVSWPAVSDCNDAQPCAAYQVSELRDGQTVATESASGGCATGGDLCATFGPIVNDGATYSYTLTAVNAEGQRSAPSAPSSPGVPAVGVPAAVSDLSATAGNTEIVADFTVPASHASSIAEVDYTLSGGANTLTGAWASPGASGQNVSETIAGLVNGTTYSLSVTACNEAGECGAVSNVVSGPQTDPYGPPNPPSVSAVASGDTVTYSWSGGGDNGRPIANYTVCIDGTCTNEGASAGSTSDTYACSSGSDTVYAYVTDTVGQQSGDSTPATATPAVCAPPMPPSVSGSVSGDSVTWSWSGGGGTGSAVNGYYLCINSSCSSVGSSAGSQTDTYGCGTTVSAYAYVTDVAGGQSGDSNAVSETTAACPPPRTITISWGSKPATYGNWLSITWSGFTPGKYTYYCNEGGVAYPFTYDLTTEPFTANEKTCEDTTPGDQVYVTTDGVTSNTIASD